jgi:hypothetical protein
MRSPAATANEAAANSGSSPYAALRLTAFHIRIPIRTPPDRGALVPNDQKDRGTGSAHDDEYHRIPSASSIELACGISSLRSRGAGPFAATAKAQHRSRPLGDAMIIVAGMFVCDRSWRLLTENVASCSTRDCVHRRRRCSPAAPPSAQLSPGH